MRFGCFGGRRKKRQAPAKMAEDGYPVKLHVYDLSQGMARQLSSTFLGKAIEAIWHTGVVVYGTEYYFGGGIQQDRPGRTPYGTPIRVVELGVTHVPREVFEDCLKEISPRYTPVTYNLLSHNCNNFSNEAVQFLVGSTIPSYILELPNEVMNSPMGALILPMIQGLETTLRAGAVPQAPQFRPPAPVAARPFPSNTKASSATADKTDANKVTDNGSVAPPAVQPAGAAKVRAAPAADPLIEAKNRVQEEIRREFTAIMATGALRASEAAALATKRVMERHGLETTAMQRG